VLFSVFVVPHTVTVKALRYGAHSFICNYYTNACLYSVSVHQMALPPTYDGAKLIAAYYSSIDPESIKG